MRRRGILNKSSPKVSIILPTCNGAKYIRQSIDSCLNQTYKNIELIIVDDGSTDETPEIIKSYKDKRIKYLRHKKNQGLPHALNTGFANATGEYLTWTSDDNFYSKKAIEKMLFFLKNKHYSFVYSDYYKFKDNNISSNQKLIQLPDFPNLKNENCIGPCFLYSREVERAIGNYDPHVELAEDYDYWIRTSKRFPMFHLGEPLYFYRTHKRSLSHKRCEVQIVSVLVRIKNAVLDADSATELFINTIAWNLAENIGLTKLNKVLLKIMFSRKINVTLRDFHTGKISFRKAKLNLINIIDRRLILFLNSEKYPVSQIMKLILRPHPKNTPTLALEVALS